VPNKSGQREPGVCGCNIADVDTDIDGIPDCQDACPDDPLKSNPGQCGCGISDAVHSDADGIPDCNDQCPSDPIKSAPGSCGCGVPDVNLNGNTTLDCKEKPLALPPRPKIKLVKSSVTVTLPAVKGVQYMLSYRRGKIPK